LGCHTNNNMACLIIFVKPPKPLQRRPQPAGEHHPARASDRPQQSGRPAAPGSPRPRPADPPRESAVTRRRTRRRTPPRDLGKAEHSIGQRLASGATTGEGTQNLLWADLAAGVLIGLTLNADFGLWWADPALALVIAALAIKEGHRAWQGEGCCATPPIGGENNTGCDGDCCHCRTRTRHNARTRCGWNREQDSRGMVSPAVPRRKARVQGVSTTDPTADPSFSPRLKTSYLAACRAHLLRSAARSAQERK